MRAIALCCLVACGPAKNQGDVDAAPVTDGAPETDATDAPPVAFGPVHVVITADNAYSFGYGDSASITHFTQGQRAMTAGQIFNCPIGEGPEVYDIAEADAPPTAYLYVVTWDDLAVTQGVLGQFERTSGTVYTGDVRFEVCATGLDYSSGPNGTVGPSLAVINEEITKCNAGSGGATTSQGWVSSAAPTTPGALGKLAVGEANDAQAGTFPITCQPTATTDGIDSVANWMWYDPVDGLPGDAFHSTGVNRFKAFLIFRLSAGIIVN
jgi:hypothetical protein